MNIDKSCYNSFCEPAATERNAAILSSYNIYYRKQTSRQGDMSFPFVLIIFIYQTRRPT